MIKLSDLVIKERNPFHGASDIEMTEDYPVTFDFDTFKGIKSYSGKLKYAQEHLGKPLGSGSSRTVYRVDNFKVLKLAKNKKGLAQNEIEIQWGNDSMFSDILANVYDFDDKDSYWVEMEVAFKVKKEDFKRLWGYDFEMIGNYLFNFELKHRNKKTFFTIPKDIEEKMDNDSRMMNLTEFHHYADSPMGDIVKLSSWGKVIRDGKEMLVLIDFGLTKDIFYTYY